MSDVLAVKDIGRVRVITLSRPDVLNAINRQMRAEMAEALRQANRDEAVGCVVLTGAGERAFAAGQDLREALQLTAERAPAWIDEFDALYSALRGLDKASIAAINGYAVGAGFQVTLLCDLRIASERAKVGMPEINDGIPCITGTWTLWDIIGRSRTTELVLTGRLLEAREALDWGLVHRVVPPAELMDAALALAEEMAAKPQTAIRLNKERWRQLTQRGAEEAREFARRAHAAAFASGEPRRAMEAFLARRKVTDS